MSDITVILNKYKRDLSPVYEAVCDQSVAPADILIWDNSQKNFGVWARFAYALNARTKYVCVFDDDTIPGKRWLENCLTTMKTHRGMLGTIGVLCQDENYFNHTRVGWANPNEETTQVDLVGHSWFFEREWLSSFWRELPPTDFSYLCGEDMHFSYTIQKYLGLNTYVPPHPPNDKELWGSLKGWELGVDEHAISHKHTHGDMRFVEEVDEYYKSLLKRGWKLVKEL